MAGYALWESGARGARGFDAGIYGDVYGRQSPAYGANDDKAANTESVRQLLSQLMDAEKTSKSQTAQELRDKLNDKREELGDEKFKEIMQELMEKADVSWLEFLRRLMKLWFPELDDESPTPSPPSPGPSPRGGGGGGGGGRPSPNNFGPSEPMSNLPITEGSKHFNYKPDESNPGKKPDNIWSGFSQGPDGNCVTVSAIKGAMMKFGQKPTDVFAEVKETSNGYYVKMRDGKEVNFSKDELRQAARYAQFKGDNPQMLTDANFMFAASAKRAQMEGNGLDDNPNESKKSFAHAMQSLNNGEMPHEALDRLGLKGLYRKSSSSELASGKLGVVAYDRHSMAVIDGKVELWGRRGGAPKQGIAYAFL
ncbi:hypothetical protein SAMN05216475_0550 [Pseudomonas synxantha]|uniref:Type III secretion effector protein n=1 Tax=Pseudomonas synxantha TaxID=47883 RepID=A0AAX3I2A9_9PSED|nr:hypothetical protein C4K01_4550 [Pseudomonas synxantha]KRP44358.1 hypothetical protein TU77_29160 [Pseudomonas synxantha]SDU02574.1 hypothetical protein SAMN05216475_0550 [Pseudomonas synxantha]VTQ92718.1 type III secretion effector protein [Pseudomonas synxantha]